MCRPMKKLFFCVVLLCAGSAHAALKIDTWTLPNGTRVLFVESHAIPVVDLSVEFDAGERRDPRNKAGLAALTNAMLARGVHDERAPQPDAAGAQGAASDAGSNANGSAAGAVMTAEPALNEAQISDAFA